MAQVFQGLKKKFESKHKKCPSCGAKISKTARICPECGHNFFFEDVRPKGFHFQLNTENCCSIFLIILIAIALLYLIFPLFKTIFLIIGVAVVVLILVILIIFAGLIYRVKKMFNF